MLVVLLLCIAIADAQYAQGTDASAQANVTENVTMYDNASAAYDAAVQRISPFEFSSEKESCPTPEATALQAFTYWHKLVDPLNQEVKLKRQSEHLKHHDDVANKSPYEPPYFMHVLNSFKLKPGNGYCLVLFTYNPHTHYFNQSSENPCPEAAITTKAALLTALFNGLAVAHPTAFGQCRFHFYVDVGDGTRFTLPFLKALQVPVLTQAKWPLDNYTIPLPDAHMVAGLLVPWLIGWIPDYLRDFAEELSMGYKLHHFKYPWSKKRDKAAWYGGCTPTMDPLDPLSFTFLRSQFCHTYSNDSANFRIGMSIEEWCRHAAFKEACEMCSKCPPPRRKVSKRLMVMSKYQVIIDGFSLSYDSTVWKLSCGSVPLWLVPEDQQQPLWVSWYYALLQPHTHYIPSCVKDVRKHMEACRSDPAPCEAMAAAARAAMVCVISQDTLLRYSLMALKYAQQLECETG